MRDIMFGERRVLYKKKPVKRSGGGIIVWATLTASSCWLWHLSMNWISKEKAIQELNNNIQYTNCPNKYGWKGLKLMFWNHQVKLLASVQYKYGIRNVKWEFTGENPQTSQDNWLKVIKLKSLVRAIATATECLNGFQACALKDKVSSCFWLCVKG